MTADKRKMLTIKVPYELYEALASAVTEGRYPNMTVAVTEALEKELQQASRSISRSDLDTTILELKSEISIKKTELEGTQKQIKDLENSAREKSTEILRLQNVIQELPDRSDLAELKGLYEGRLQVIEEKDKSIERLEREVETLNVFAHYFKNVEIKQIEAPAAVKVKPWWKFW